MLRSKVRPGHGRGFQIALAHASRPYGLAPRRVWVTYVQQYEAIDEGDCAYREAVASAAGPESPTTPSAWRSFEQAHRGGAGNEGVQAEEILG